MRLVYDNTGIEVKTGDVVHIDDVPHYVVSFNKPHKSSSSGKVSVKEMTDKGFSAEYYVSVIDATWIEREDRYERISSDQVLFFIGDTAQLETLAELVCSVANGDYSAKDLYDDISLYMLTGKRLTDEA